MWDGFGFTVNARLRERPDDAGRHEHRPRQGRHLRRRSTKFNNVTADHRRHRRSRPARLPQRRAVADDAARPGELHHPEGRRARQRGRCARSRRCSSATTTVHTAPVRAVAGAELGDRGGARPSAAGCDGDRQHDHPARPTTSTASTRDERRTQVDMRFAKIVRFGRTRTDIGVDLNNLLNTNYATGFNHDLHLQHGQHAAPERLGHAEPASTTRGSCV